MKNSQSESAHEFQIQQEDFPALPRSSKFKCLFFSFSKRQNKKNILFVYFKIHNQRRVQIITLQLI